MDTTKSLPVVAVVGISGAQGGSVARALLKDGGYCVRGLTRSVSSEKSRELFSYDNATAHLALKEGDYTDEVVLERLFTGADVAFVVTNFWDPATQGRELEIGLRMASVAHSCGVQHLIWSSLPNVEKLSGGALHVPHFTHKAKVEEGIAALGFAKTTSIGAAFYYQNFGTFFPPRADPDQAGGWVISLPLPADAPLTAYDVEDTGGLVLAALKAPEKYGAGTFLAAAGVHQTPVEFCQQLQDVSGVPVRYEAMSAEDYANLGFPGARELAEMFEWFRRYTYFGPKLDRDSGRKAFPALKNFREWLLVSGWRPHHE